MGIFEIKFEMGMEIGMFWFGMGVVFGELDVYLLKFFIYYFLENIYCKDKIN